MNKPSGYDIATNKRADKKRQEQHNVRNINIDIARYCGEIKTQDEIFEMYRQFDADYTVATESNPTLKKAEFRRGYTRFNLDNLFRCLNSLNKKQKTSTECDLDDLGLVMNALSLVDNQSGGAGRTRSKSKPKPTAKKETEITNKELEAAEALAAFYNYNNMPHGNIHDVAALNSTIEQDNNNILKRGAKIYHNLSECAQSYMSYAWAKASGLLKDLTDNEAVTKTIEYTKQNMYSTSAYVITVGYIGSTGLPQDIIKILYNIFTSSMGLFFIKHIGGLSASIYAARKLELIEKLTNALYMLKNKVDEMTNEKDVQTILSYIKTLNMFKSAAELEAADSEKELEVLKKVMATAKNEGQQIVEINNVKDNLTIELDQLSLILEEAISTDKHLQEAKTRRSSLKNALVEQKKTNKKTEGGKRHTKKRRIHKRVARRTKTHRK